MGSLRCRLGARCDEFDDSVSKTISTPASSLRWSERDATVPWGLMRYLGSISRERLWPISPHHADTALQRFALIGYITARSCWLAANRFIRRSVCRSR